MPAKQDQGIVCEAPCDAIVSGLTTIEGPVKSGQALATLKSSGLDRFASSLDWTATDLEIQERAFTEHRTDRMLVVLREQYEAAKANADAEQHWLDVILTMLKFGTASSNDVPKFRGTAAKAKIAEADAESDLVHSQGKYSDKQDRLKLSRSRLEQHRRLLGELTQRLNLQSPSDGYFVASVGVGGFVMMGDPIGTIYPSRPNSAGRSLTCAAPEDVSVIELVTASSRVRPGQVVARLASKRIEELKNKLDATATEIEIRGKPFTDGRSEKLQAILNHKAASAEQAFEAAQKAFDIVNAQLRYGTKLGQDTLIPLADKAEARAKMVSAGLDRDEYPNKLRDLRDYIENDRERLKRDRAIVDQMTKSLELRAAADGDFVASVGIGGFVRLGDPVGVLNL
jgi:hypothetical protein